MILREDRAVGYWVLAGTLMLVVQVMLGGITRLSGSGLSITEWDLFTGAVPPLNTDQWLSEFSKYQHTPQYKLLNAGFTLRDFKFIFFWEWLHRFWARLVGVVFIAGFVYLVWKRKMKGWMVKPLLVLFLLGALQGMIGWVMVVSGLTGDAIYVQPTKLALHFIFALGLISYSFWFGLQLIVPLSGGRGTGRVVRNLTRSILLILFFQLLYGALMAGSKAAAVAPTWPTINGDLVPPGLLKETPAFLNLVKNTITIHFIHRGLAYLLLLLVFAWSWSAVRLNQGGRLLPVIPLLLILVQIVLGIGAVLSSPGIAANRWMLFDWIALLHQVTGMLFLLVMVYMLYVFQRR
jgi:heme a synthase